MWVTAINQWSFFATVITKLSINVILMHFIGNQTVSYNILVVSDILFFLSFYIWCMHYSSNWMLDEARKATSWHKMTAIAKKHSDHSKRSLQHLEDTIEQMTEFAVRLEAQMDRMWYIYGLFQDELSTNWAYSDEEIRDININLYTMWSCVFIMQNSLKEMKDLVEQEKMEKRWIGCFYYNNDFTVSNALRLVKISFLLLKNASLKYRTQHPFHLVNHSPWPFYTSISTLFLFSGAVAYMHRYSYGDSLMLWGLFCLVITVLFWFTDVIYEGTDGRYHTKAVRIGLRLGMKLFIVSEIMFFLSFFWAYFHAALSPTWSIVTWPPAELFVHTVNLDKFLSENYLNPVYLIEFNPVLLPIVNTCVLLLSGLSITWAHWAVISKNYNENLLALGLTCILGVYFSWLQGLEYLHLPFNINDSVFGSIFYMATGFHGLHVLIGTSLLYVCLIRFISFHFTPKIHVGYEAAIWYWHFVDIVWIFLYAFVYVWGGIHNFSI